MPGSAPREIVESFPATAENYKKAFEYLKERFGKESVLIQVYIRDLLQLVISKNKCELSSLYDKLQTRIRSLDSLGLTKDKYANILFPLVESTLPIDTVKMLDRQRHLVKDTQVNSNSVHQLWCLDVLGITGSAHRRTAKELEEETTKYFNETLCVNAEGRYEVLLPWLVDNFSLPENRKLAEKSLLSTKRKLMTSGKIEAYGEVFDNWLTLGIIEKIPQGETGRVHYLPHRPVINESNTTSIRPVFNESSHALGFPSLNDCLSTGPNLIEIILTILNRFRRNYVGVTSDIEKAFLQISIREKDRDYLRFLWLRKDDLEQVEEYRHRRVVFGLTCGPYLLAATLQCHLNRVQDLSCTSEILKTAFYVDNCVTSLDSELEMRKFILEFQIIMSSGNFNLRGWNSNLHSVVPKWDTSTDENVSVLGLVWHTDTDTLSCKVEQTVTLEKPITKRY
ncbi:hypothetical protein AVEN_230878-1 [Araneus ventricosus]|uniref:Reverse transcriptase domain-containing protein n=1 Tax=Araneus ventricosus TaxID=182803 RepID=A0A4Y2A2D3_ARAVE|nr:hypothetical protein AVEN_230878-1 [Araneus ventricosus]